MWFSYILQIVVCTPLRRLRLRVRLQQQRDAALDPVLRYQLAREVDIKAVVRRVTTRLQNPSPATLAIERAREVHRIWWIREGGGEEEEEEAEEEEMEVRWLRQPD